MAGGRLWEPKEVALVRAMGPGPVEVRRVARELGRSPQAVRTRKFVLGLSESDRWTREEIAELDHLVAGGLAIEDAAAELGRSRRAAVALACRGARVY